MKTDFTLSELLDSEFQDGIDRILAFEGCFSDMVSAVGLDPKYDFRHSDLRNVDFSYADIRGFDFTGADLSNTSGMDVLLDDTTIFTRATLVGSIFEKRVEENELLARNKEANQIYKLLKEGDTYQVSSWISNRNEGLAKRYRNAVSEQEATILCRKLITDSIDLTKRTTLFYHLRKLTSNSRELRSVVSDFLAFHLDDPQVVRAFVKVTGDLFPRDEYISNTILRLCQHQSIEVRSVAFSAISKTKMFLQNYRTVEALFSERKNERIRKQFILETAIRMGRSNVLAINTAGENRQVDYEYVLDQHELLDEEVCNRIRMSQSQRASQQKVREIIERQQEVLAAAPLFSRLLKIKKTPWLQAARSRSREHYDLLHRELEAKINNAYRNRY